MAGVSSKSFDTPDEVRTPDKTKVDVVRLGGETVARITFQPGWRWSECVKPVARTDSCQARHVGAIVAGRMRVVHNDGTEGEFSAGDAYVIEPGELPLCEVFETPDKTAKITPITAVPVICPKILDRDKKLLSNPRWSGFATSIITVLLGVLKKFNPIAIMPIRQR